MKPFIILKFILIAPIFLLVFTCKNSSESSAPEYDPNFCTDYSCPLHKDKMSVTLDFCPECGIKMIDAKLLESYLHKTAHSIYDSIHHYNEQILKYSYIITNAENKSQKNQISYAWELSKTIDKALVANDNLDQLVFGKHRVIIKPHSQNIDKLYAVATYRISAIIKELEKPHYDEAKIKLYTHELMETIYEVDEEQAILKIK
jgi:hypothetical protein